MRGVNSLTALFFSSMILPASLGSSQASRRDAQVVLSGTTDGVTGGQERYDGESVWRVKLGDHDRARREEVVQMFESLGGDIWHTTSDTIDVRLDSTSSQLLMDNQLHATTTIEPFIPDLQSLIDSINVDLESTSTSFKKKNNNRNKNKQDPFNLTTIDTPFHDTYHSVEDLYKFGDKLVETFDGKDGVVVTSFEIGETFEGKKLRGWSAKLQSNSSGSAMSTSGRTRTDRGGGGVTDGIEREFVVQSGQHGREWVGPSSAFYFLHSLILAATSDPSSEAALLLRSFTFTVVPLINPDGYTYSREHSRLWRKNRQQVGSKSCLGIDLNSNWGYKWRYPKAVSPCSESYPGKEAFEAYETKAMGYYLGNGTERGTKIRAFVDLHSYGQLFMFPFAHSCEDYPSDAEMLMEAGLGVAKAMRTKQGEGYEAGQACDLTYRAPGDAIDFAYGVTDIRWSYSAELRDTGTYGFMLPPSLIRPTADEITAGLMYLAKFIYVAEIAN